MNWLSKEKAQLSQDFLRLTQTRKSEIGNKEILILPFVKPMELYQANQWADQAQRENINSCGELEMRNGLFQESRARNCQEPCN